jgi:hypothetical protein
VDAGSVTDEVWKCRIAAASTITFTQNQKLPTTPRLLRLRATVGA